MTTYKEQAIEFLATKENIGEALEVEGLMPDVRRMLEDRFWERLFDNLEGRLKSSSVHGWKVHRDLEKNEKALRVQIEPNDMHKPYYSPVIEMDYRGRHSELSYGLRYSQESQPDLAEVRRLGEDIVVAKAKEPDGGSVKKNERWWLVWWWTGASYGDDKFYLQMAEAPDRLINEHADLLWRLFDEHRKAIEHVNRKIASQVMPKG